MTGWVSLHRDITQWEWYDDINTCRVFIHCLIKANHEPAKWRGIEIERGQFISSTSKMASETNLTVKQVRNSISKLNKTGEVASEGHTQHTVFTIKNYDKYQREGKQTGKRGANEGQTKGKRRATNNNNNNEKNDNKGIICYSTIKEIFNGSLTNANPIAKLTDKRKQLVKKLFDEFNLDYDKFKSYLEYMNDNPDCKWMFEKRPKNDGWNACKFEYFVSEKCFLNVKENL
jgi:predicted transcriptional regulator